MVIPKFCLVPVPQMGAAASARASATHPKASISQAVQDVDVSGMDEAQTGEARATAEQVLRLMIERASAETVREALRGGGATTEAIAKAAELDWDGLDDAEHARVVTGLTELLRKITSG